MPAPKVLETVEQQSNEAVRVRESIRQLPARERRKVWRLGHMRNKSCPCGSGKKLKKCCLNKPYVPPVDLTLPDAPDELELAVGMVRAAGGTGVKILPTVTAAAVALGGMR